MKEKKSLDTENVEVKESDVVGKKADEDVSLVTNGDVTDKADEQNETVGDSKDQKMVESSFQDASKKDSSNADASGWGASPKEETFSNWGASGDDDLGNWGQEAEPQKDSVDVPLKDEESNWGASESAYKKEDSYGSYGSGKQNYENPSRSQRDYDGYDNDRKFESRGGDRRENHFKSSERRYDDNNSSYPSREDYPRKRFERSENERDYGYGRDEKRTRSEGDREYDRRSYSYDRRQDRGYDRRQDSFERRSEGYDRRSDGYDRRLDSYERRSDRGYDRRSDRGGYEDSYGRSQPMGDSRYPPRENRSHHYERYNRNEDRGSSYDPMRNDRGSYDNSRSKKTIPTNVEPSKAIGIFGLSIHATEEDLREFLNEHLNEINDFKITIIHDRNTGRSRGFGFVYFQSLEDSMTAKERLSGKSIKGKEIRVDYSVSDVLRPNYH